MENNNESKVNKTIESKPEVVKINENQHADISGGYVFDANGSNNYRYRVFGWPEPESVAGDSSKPFEVIDDGNGAVLGRYATKEEAHKMAKRKAQSTKEISRDEVKDLRNA